VTGYMHDKKKTGERPWNTTGQHGIRFLLAGNLRGRMNIDGCNSILGSVAEIGGKDLSDWLASVLDQWRRSEGLKKVWRIV